MKKMVKQAGQSKLRMEKVRDSGLGRRKTGHGDVPDSHRKEVTEREVVVQHNYNTRSKAARSSPATFLDEVRLCRLAKARKETRQLLDSLSEESEQSLSLSHMSDPISERIAASPYEVTDLLRTQESTYLCANEKEDTATINQSHLESNGGDSIKSRITLLPICRSISPTKRIAEQEVIPRPWRTAEMTVKNPKIHVFGLEASATAYTNYVSQRSESSQGGRKLPSQKEMVELDAATRHRTEPDVKRNIPVEITTYEITPTPVVSVQGNSQQRKIGYLKSRLLNPRSDLRENPADNASSALTPIDTVTMFPAPSYKCTVCKFITTDFNSLKRHTVEKHRLYVLHFCCSLCGLSVSSLAKIREHVRTLHGANIEKSMKESWELPIACNLCNQRFNSERARKLHTKEKHWRDVFVQPRSITNAITIKSPQKSTFPIHTAVASRQELQPKTPELVEESQMLLNNRFSLLDSQEIQTEIDSARKEAAGKYSKAIPMVPYTMRKAAPPKQPESPKLRMQSDNKPTHFRSRDQHKDCHKAIITAKKMAIIELMEQACVLNFDEFSEAMATITSRLVELRSSMKPARNKPKFVHQSRAVKTRQRTNFIARASQCIPGFNIPNSNMNILSDDQESAVKDDAVSRLRDARPSTNTMDKQLIGLFYRNPKCLVRKIEEGLRTPYRNMDCKLPPAEIAEQFRSLYHHKYQSEEQYEEEIGEVMGNAIDADTSQTNDSDFTITESLLYPISYREFMMAKGRLNLKSSPGPDKTVFQDWLWLEDLKCNDAPEHSRDMPTSEEPKLIHIFNKVLMEGRIPKCWNTSRTILVPKFDRSEMTKDPSMCNELSNYRPISITNSLYRFLMTILASRLRGFCERRRLLHRGQRGFTAVDGCLENTHLLRGVIRAVRNNKIKERVISFIDIKRAFDSVAHVSIFRALVRKKVPLDLIHMVADIYRDCKTNIQPSSCPNSYTIPLTLTRGVRQGCPLSPLLFNLTVDALLDLIEKPVQPPVEEWEEIKLRIEGDDAALKTQILAFADDIVVISDSVLKAKEDIQTLMSGAGTMGMEINMSKCGHHHIISPNTSRSRSNRQSASVNTNPMIITEEIQISNGDGDGDGDERDNNNNNPNNTFILHPIDDEKGYRYLGTDCALQPMKGSRTRHTISGTIESMTELMEKIAKAPILGWQRLWLIRTFVFPRINHISRLDHIPAKTLDAINRKVRELTREILKLPAGTNTNFMEASHINGGLNLIDMRILHNINQICSFVSLLNSNDNCILSSIIHSLKMDQYWKDVMLPKLGESHDPIRIVNSADDTSRTEETLEYSWENFPRIITSVDTYDGLRAVIAMTINESDFCEYATKASKSDAHNANLKCIRLMKSWDLTLTVTTPEATNENESQRKIIDISLPSSTSSNPILNDIVQQGTATLQSDNTSSGIPTLMKSRSKLLRTFYSLQETSQWSLKTDQGRCVPSFSQCIHSNSFILWNNQLDEAEYHFALKGRLNLLPTPSVLARQKRLAPGMRTSCNKCGTGALATLNHIINVCQANKSLMYDRHDGIVEAIVNNSRKKKSQFAINRTIAELDEVLKQRKDADVELVKAAKAVRSLRPDIVLRDYGVDNKIVIVDVGISFDNSQNIKSYEAEKIAKYNKVVEVMKKVVTCEVEFYPLIIGSLGSVSFQHLDVLRALKIKKPTAFLRKISAMSIKGSRNIYYESYVRDWIGMKVGNEGMAVMSEAGVVEERRPAEQISQSQ